MSHLTIFPSPFVTTEAGLHPRRQCGKHQPSFNHPQQQLHTTSHHPQRRRQQQRRNDNPRVPTNQDESAPAKTNHKHPHERRPVPRSRNRSQRAEVRQARLLPTTHLSNTESRCHVAVGNMPAKLGMSLVVVYFRMRW